MKKVIVTGAIGFIGREIVRMLNSVGTEVYAVVRNDKRDISVISEMENVNIVYCEMEQIDKLKSLLPDRDIDTCIHLAWEGSFGDARADYHKQLLNIEYSLNLIDTLAEMKVRRFVGAGTLAEKDVLNYHPNPGATPNAVSIYGIAKSAAHFMTKAECTKVGMEHVWCYLSNTYGVGNTTGNFVNMACNKMLTGQRAAFTAGEQMYDFVYITDTVRAILAASEKGRSHTAYYLGSTKARKLKEYIKIIHSAIDESIVLHLGEIPFNGNSLPAEAYDTSQLVQDTGYEPEIDFEEGITKTIDWLRSRL